MKESISYRVKELDAFRGFAAFFVLFFHFTMFREESNYGFFLGISGVDLFFMISGFVIFMSIDKRKNGRGFVLFRLIRLYPIYWVIATFTFLLYFILNLLGGVATDVEIPFVHYLVNLTMFQYFFNYPNIDGSYWTLIIEMLFYIFIYILFRFQLLNKIVTVGVLFNLLIFVLVFSIRNYSVYDFTDNFPLIYHFPMFFIGILFYKMFLKKRLNFIYCLSILACIFLQIYLENYGRATQFMSIYSYGIMLVIYSILFSLFVMNKLNIIVNQFTTYLGDISYSLYLLHQPLCYGIIIPYFTDQLKLNFWISSLLISLPIVMIIATFLTYKVEKPMRSFLRLKLVKSKLIG